MLYDIEETVRRKAKTPHELFMLNLAVFHLLLAPAAIVLKIGPLAFLLPLLLSLSVITYTWVRGRRAEHGDHWFVMAHWKLAFRRYRILLIAYAISATVVSAGLLISGGVDKKTTQEILLTVFERIAVVPTLITVMVCFVLESSAIYQATRGEVPEGLVRRFPPPESLRAREEKAVA